MHVRRAHPWTWPLALLAACVGVAHEEPAPIEPVRIEVGELRFDALAAGDPDGELVLLLHGFPQGAEAFRAQLPALAAAGFRAVAPDQRGYSPGARPERREEYVMSGFVADVLGMADALGRERFHLVGHDWGGAVAWVTATLHPERVLTLTVLSTPHVSALSAARGDADGEQAARSAYFADFGAPGAEERFLADDAALLREILAELPDEQRAVYVEKLGSPEAMRAALAWYHVFARPNAPAPSTTPPPALPPIRVPTLYVWGTRDASFGRAAAERTRDHVDAPYTFHALEGEGHWLPELAADEVEPLLLAHLRGADR